MADVVGRGVVTALAEGIRRCLQLKTLIEGMYLGYYMLDRLKFQSLEEESVEDEVSHQSQSFAVSTFRTAKCLHFVAAVTKNTPVAFGIGGTTKPKGVLESLEAKIADMREFVMLLGSCPRLPRHPYTTYLFMDKCMFGRQIEKEQVIYFSLCNDSHGCPNVSILVQHASKDETQRVRNCFSHMLFFKGDDLRKGEFAVKCKAVSGKYLFVIQFGWDVDEAAWTSFQSYLQKVSCSGSKIVVSRASCYVRDEATHQDDEFVSRKSTGTIQGTCLWKHGS